MELTDRQKRVGLKLANILDNKERGVAHEISLVEDAILSIDERLDYLENGLQDIIDIVSETQKMEGPPGYTPIKGINYNDGENYILTEENMETIAGKIKVPIVEKIIEKTTVIKEQPVVTQVTKEFKIKSLIAAEDVRDKLETLSGEERLDISAIKGLGKRLSLLSDTIINRAIGILDQRTSFLINKLSNLSDRVDRINVTPAAGGTWYQEAVVGTINSINVTFTLQHTPVSPASLQLYLGHQLQIQGVDYTISGATITYIVAPDSSLSGDHYAIYQ